MTGSMSECAHGCGTHIHPDMVYVEILDEHGAPCPPGEPGALVVTPLNAEGTPLLRYRTGDIAFVVDAPCRCGRHSPRLGPVLAREGQMLKIKGTKVYPAAISEALSGIPEIESFVIIAESDEHHGDRVRIVAATTLDPTRSPSGWRPPCVSGRGSNATRARTSSGWRIRRVTARNLCSLTGATREPTAGWFATGISRMHIHFIFPRWRKLLEDYPELRATLAGYEIGSFRMAGLGIPAAAAAVPDGIEVTLTDEHVTAVDFDARPDLVALSYFTPQAARAHAIADHFRAAGVR
jgi:hypothetical protein